MPALALRWIESLNPLHDLDLLFCFRCPIHSLPCLSSLLTEHVDVALFPGLGSSREAGDNLLSSLAGSPAPRRLGVVVMGLAVVVEWPLESVHGLPPL